MWWGEPTSAPVIVIRSSDAMIRAMPKSASLTAGGSPSWTSTFSGFRSRWITPAEWACTSASVRARPTSSADLGVAEADLGREGAQRPAAHELGDEVALDRRVAGVVVDLDDARVREPGDRARLAGEAGPGLGRGGEVRVEELHRDLAVERGVAAAVHDRHPAAPHLLEELVAAQHPDHRTSSAGRRTGCSGRDPG